MFQPTHGTNSASEFTCGLTSSKVGPVAPATFELASDISPPKLLLSEEYTLPSSVETVKYLEERILRDALALL